MKMRKWIPSVRYLDTPSRWYDSREHCVLAHRDCETPVEIVVEARVVVRRTPAKKKGRTT